MAYLRCVPQTVRQPGGDVVRCLASGDEHYNWLHDSDGYVIIQDQSTGYYVYARKVGEELTPTDAIVGTTDPASMGIETGLKPSPEVLKGLRVGRFPRQQDIEEVNAPTTGTINSLVVFIRFSDDTDFANLLSSYQALLNSTGTPSQRSYFWETSYNQLTVASHFFPVPDGQTVLSYQDSHPRNYFRRYSVSNPSGYQNSDERRSREQTMLKNAVDAISSQVPTDLVIDSDDDGYVDSMCFIIKGAAEGWNDLLWPHQWVLYTQVAMINGKRVWNYSFQLNDNLGTGVLCHEMFHVLGAPDLYHYNQDGLEPAGKWDIMERDLDPPQYMGAFMKYRYGKWIDSIPKISAPGTYTIEALQSSTGNAFRIDSPNCSTQYFVVEYRRKEGMFESSLPGTGLLVYRINSELDGQGNAEGPPDEVYIYRPGGSPTQNGTPDSANFGLDVGRPAFDGAYLADGSPGGLDISEIGGPDPPASAAQGPSIGFRLNGGPPPPPVVVSTDPANGTADVPVAQVIAVRFDAAVFPGSTFSGIALTNTATMLAVPINTSISGMTLSITPVQALAYGTNFEAFLPSGAVANAEQVELAADYAFYFDTEAAPIVEPTVQVKYIRPMGDPLCRPRFAALLKYDGITTTTRIYIQNVSRHATRLRLFASMPGLTGSRVIRDLAGYQTICLAYDDIAALLPPGTVLTEGFLVIQALDPTAQVVAVYETC